MEPLREALRRLQEEFGGRSYYEVRITVSLAVTKGEAPETKVHRYVQVDSASGDGETLDRALAEIRQEQHFLDAVAGYAEKIAAAVREVSGDAFYRERAIMAARTILDREWRERSEADALERALLRREGKSDGGE